MNGIFIKSKINLFTIYDMIFPLELVSTVHDMDWSGSVQEWIKMPTNNKSSTWARGRVEWARKRDTENEKKDTHSHQTEHQVFVERFLLPGMLIIAYF